MTWISEVKLEPCLPPKWAHGGHAQTILGHILPSRSLVPRHELRGIAHEIELPDGDRLVARHISGEGDHVLYVFHGIMGDVSADYMIRTAALGRRLGWDVYLVNHRGCGEGRGLARRSFHAGRAEDLSAVIRFGRSRHPKKKHVAIGFSLSANALLLLLSGTRGGVLPDAAMAVNGPIDLARASTLLGQGLNRLYDFRFSRDCRLDVRFRRQAGLLEKDYVFSRLLTLREFDSVYTCPEGGFESRDEYYSTCSAKSFLSLIRTPTVLMTAKDDPFIDYRDYEKAVLSPWIHLHVESVGGHMGYLTCKETPLGTRRWLDYAIFEFINEFK